MKELSDEVLLKVERLCQYFKMGDSELKAVDDVSFEVRRGEVFGIVGESGCGKTTTGRSIIKLYDATGGNVYLKGIRICAGGRSYQDAIEKAREQKDAALEEIKKSYAQSKAEINEYGIIGPAADAIKGDYLAKKDAVEEKFKELKSKNEQEIREAKFDQKFCDKTYAQNCLMQVKDEYASKFELVGSDEVAAAALKQEYAKACRVAKKRRLVTQIQMIFQDPIASLNPRMTVREIIAEGLIINGVHDKKTIDEKVYEVLNMVGLVREHAGRYPHEFSGGQRQRIGIARSIIMNPELLIADEPVSALDVSIQAQVITLLNELREKIGLTIIFIAHDISVVKYFSDRIAVMYYGRIMETAATDELFKNPMHPYTKALLSAVPLPDPLYEKQRKRIIYNPLSDHDYSSDKPEMREITQNHFVYCNEAEFKKYTDAAKS